MIISESIKRPFTNFSRLIIGILISSIPIVNFLSIGYFLECYRTSRKKDYELPEWKDIWNKFSEGSFAFLIILIYFIPFIAMIKIAGLNYLDFMSAQVFESITTTNLAILSFLNFFAIYLIPISLKKYALTNSIREVFSKEVFRNAFKKNYLIIWIIGISLLILISVLFSFIPYIGEGIIIFLTGTIFSTYYGAKND